LYPTGALHDVGGRFTLERELGAGSFGVVFEATDRRHGGRVALKLLRRERARAAARFKHEFRGLVDLAHPNLVRLFELAAHGDALFFTMELVEGTDFLTHVRGADGPADRPAAPGTVTETQGAAELPLAAPPATSAAPAVDAARLLAAVSQLADGVHALHTAGKLHCDLKPSNVLVDAAGRVVVVDFGLATDLGAEGARSGPARAWVGTPGYVAPEVVAGAARTPAADWYAVGAMLYQALVGELPAPGARCTAPAPELALLAALCEALIDPRPAHRPSGPEICARLGGGASLGSARPSRLIGRDRELAALRDAWAAVRAGEPALVRIVGTAGVGKTALIERFVADVRAEPGGLALAGRCFEEDSVPYKALDGVIDALAEHLGQLRGAAAPALDHGAELARLFPVLGAALGAALGAPLGTALGAPLGDRAPHGAAPPAAALDSQAARRRGAAALRALLAQLAAAQPLVCVLDDLQWGDVDSARLLADIVRPPDAPRMLVIASHRPSAPDDAGFLAALDERPLGIRDTRLALRELEPGAAAELARDLLGEREPTALTVGRESGGNPLFIQQLVAAAREAEPAAPRPALDLAGVIRARVDALEPEARALVQIVALASGPLDEVAAIEAAAIAPGTARAAAIAVRRARLVSAVGTGIGLVPAHDRVREAVAAAIPPATARAGHRRIAHALLARPAPDPDALVHHFRGAGDAAQTHAYALVAAERAERALAFERAAAHLELALGTGGLRGAPRARILERRGAALANAGRTADAAEAFERAAAELDVQPAPARAAAEQLTLRRRAAELTLRSGRIHLGTSRMHRVLREVGVRPPASRAAASVLALARRARLFAQGLGALAPRAAPAARAAEVGAPLPAARAAARERLDALWSATTGVSMVNHVLADALGLQHLLEAIRLGERTHLVRGLGYEAAFEAVIGGRLLRARCARILTLMDELAATSADPYDRAWAQLSRGVTSWFLGDWPAAWRNCDRAAALFRDECRGVAWELAICDAYRLPALAYLGELAELARVVPAAYAGARERGDLFAMSSLRLGQQSMTWLADGRPAEAIAEASAAIAPFPSTPYLLPHYHHLFARAQAELYRGEPAAAWSAIERARPGLRHAQLLRVQCLRVEIRHLRARAALALAASGHPAAADLRAAARREASVIAADAVAPARPLAAALRAALARAVGDRSRARAELASAATGFAAAHMQLYAHACGDRLGALEGGSAGAARRAAARAWMARAGVRDPDALIAMLVPGA
jgi:hypothetical protein